MRRSFHIFPIIVLASTALMALSLAWAEAPAPAPSRRPDPVPTRQIKGTLKVNRTWAEVEDGIVTVKHDTACQMAIQVPVFDFRNANPPYFFQGATYECNTTYLDGSPALVKTAAVLTYFSGKNGAGLPVQRKNFSANYSVNGALEKGGLATFSTQEVELKDITVSLQNPADVSPEQPSKEAFFSVALSIEDQP